MPHFPLCVFVCSNSPLSLLESEFHERLGYSLKLAAYNAAQLSYQGNIRIPMRIREIIKGLFFLPIIILLLPGARGETQVCDSLESCLNDLATPPQLSDKGMSGHEQAVAKQLQGYGRAAVGPLLGLLRATDDKVRDRAGYTLADIDPVTVEDLPALKTAMSEGNGWVARAIARIGTPEAIQALVENLRRNPESVPNQTTVALERLGDKAVPYLLQAYTCKPRCGSVAFIRALTIVFGRMEEKAEPAVTPLIAKANDTSQPLPLRIAALRTLEAIGPYAKAQRHFLRPLLDSPQPDLARAASGALTRIGDASVVENLLNRLDSEKSADGKWLALLRIGAWAARVYPRHPGYACC